VKQNLFIYFFKYLLETEMFWVDSLWMHFTWDMFMYYLPTYVCALEAVKVVMYPTSRTKGLSTFECSFVLFQS